MKSFRTSALAGLLAAVVAALSGCASTSDVDKRIAESQAKTDKKIESVEGQVEDYEEIEKQLKDEGKKTGRDPWSQFLWRVEKKRLDEIKLRDIEAYYKVKYDTVQDWTHTGTGLKGIKAQHPETEFFWESKHYKAGATCRDCHMGFVADGKPRSHWFTSSLKQVPETCGKCHGTAADTYVKKVTDAQDVLMAKATAAENSLDAVLTKIESCTTAGGCDATKLLQAKEAFMKGLLWWEFTVVSENSAGWHNPDEANTNLDTAQAQADAAKVLLGL